MANDDLRALQAKIASHSDVLSQKQGEYESCESRNVVQCQRNLEQFRLQQKKARAAERALRLSQLSYSPCF